MFIAFENINPAARIWIYQASRELTAEEEATIKNKGRQFVEQWTAHKQNLLASFEILHHLFLIVAVDETVNDASGCSIDKAFGFIRQLENDYKINLLDRRAIAYEKNDEIVLTSLTLFEKLFKEGKISDQDLIYNNLINTKSELAASWRIPVHKSWLMQVM